MRHLVCIDIDLFRSYFSALYFAKAASNLFLCKGLN